MLGGCSGSQWILWPFHRLSCGIRLVPVHLLSFLTERIPPAADSSAGAGYRTSVSSRYSFCCLRENGRINKWHLVEEGTGEKKILRASRREEKKDRAREKARGREKRWKRNREQEEDRSFFPLPFHSFLFSCCFVVLLVALVHAVSRTLRSAARPFVVPALPFVSPATNETPCL